MRVILVHNPGAGDGGQPGASELRQLIEAAGHEAFYQSCADEGWATAFERPADLVAVAGGDGTVGRVAKALVGRRLPFTALPLGTANNISKSLGLTDASLEQLIRAWKNAQRTKFDIGVARGPWGLRYFMEGMGSGLFARTMPEADRNPTLASLDSADAKVTYALQILREQLDEYRSRFFRATLDGRDVSGEYLLLEAMNMQYVGPNLYLGPDCDFRDGLLDVVVVAPEERAKLHRYLSTWQNGRLHIPDLTTWRGRELRVEWTGFKVHIDDEVWPEEGASHAAPATMTIAMEHDALEFLAPEP
jgi:diacylglycerol kinase family enzyme